MNVCHVRLGIWLKVSSHDHNELLKWKGYSLACVSKVKGLFSLMSYYDKMLNKSLVNANVN